ncbi:hypothetical protein [Paenibacillus hamazuiensis]|uniref:hypothetical protein n=1 Tax=Paenibacillus hamazuiensis TaxID=2936508 RepID=UPI00200D80E9|nr:hypothetical protein [Paenibacillus hamazuiensis]
MSDGKRQRRYDRLFKLFSGKVEKAFIRFIIGLTALLIASQLLLQIQAVRLFLVKVEQLEGTPYRR